jgi:hypothetical protein
VRARAFLRREAEEIFSSHNYFQKSFIASIPLKQPPLTPQTTRRNPFPSPQFLDPPCYVPIREVAFSGRNLVVIFLARKHRSTVMLDFRMEPHSGVPLK